MIEPQYHVASLLKDGSGRCRVWRQIFCMPCLTFRSQLHHTQSSQATLAPGPHLMWPQTKRPPLMPHSHHPFPKNTDPGWQTAPYSSRNVFNINNFATLQCLPSSSPHQRSIPSTRRQQTLANWWGSGERGCRHVANTKRDLRSRTSGLTFIFFITSDQLFIPSFGKSQRPACRGPKAVLRRKRMSYAKTATHWGKENTLTAY